MRVDASAVRAVTSRAAPLAGPAGRAAVSQAGARLSGSGRSHYVGAVATEWRFRAMLWQWQARSDSWQFVSIPPDVSADISEVPRMPRGFGSVRMRVTIGGTTWRTSVFLDSASGGYVLPVKKAVRAAEGIDDGDEVELQLTLVDEAR